MAEHKFASFHKTKRLEQLEPNLMWWLKVTKVLSHDHDFQEDAPEPGHISLSLHC